MDELSERALQEIEGAPDARSGNGGPCLLLQTEESECE